MLRRHQREFQEVVRDIASGRSIRHILASITPGGGKSMLPLILAREIAIQNNWRICWVVPRVALGIQGERSFMSPFARSIVGNAGEIRYSDGNTINPSRGTRGYVTTYQTVARNPQAHSDEFRLRKYILFLDEVHHVPYIGSEDREEKAYYEAIAPLVEMAQLVVHATGTLERHDGEQIAFLPYTPITTGVGMGKFVDMTSLPAGWAGIRYSRTDALEEDAIVPLHFSFGNGAAVWIDKKTGEVCTVESIANASKRDNSKIVSTILETEYAHSLLEGCYEQWRQHKDTQYAKAQMLVVAPNIDIAKSYTDYLVSHPDVVGRIDIATSDDSSEAKQNIDRFSKGAIDILVTVGMAYEGLDVPPVSHIAVLTNIRSKPWLEQCFARAARTDAKNGKTHGYIWVPDDPMMREIVEAIRQEQQGVVKPKFQVCGPGSGPGRGENGLVPLASSYHQSRSLGLEDNTSIDYDETESMLKIMRQLGIKGVSPVQMKQFMVLHGSGIVPNGDDPQPDYNEPVVPYSVLESQLKTTLYKTVNRIAKGDPDVIQTVNADIKRRWTSRELMTIEQLQQAIKWLDDTYGGITR